MPYSQRKPYDRSESDMPLLLEYMPIYAKMLRAKFEALCAEGFTQEQAIQLCQKLF